MAIKGDTIYAFYDTRGAVLGQIFLRGRDLKRFRLARSKEMLDLPVVENGSGQLFQILTSQASAHAAYSSARAKPRVVVTPQVLPGPGFVVGVNYLFQAVYPEGEDLTWTVSKQHAFYPQPESFQTPTLAAEEASLIVADTISRGAVLKSGKSNVFTFCPTESGRYTVRLDFRQDDVGFEDALVVHANASPESSVTYHVLVALACIAASATVVVVTAVVCAVLLRS